MHYLVSINNITHRVMEWQFLKTEITINFRTEATYLTSSSIPNTCSTFYRINEEDSSRVNLREMSATTCLIAKSLLRSYVTIVNGQQNPPFLDHSIGQIIPPD
jgi:hypothetical protein